MRESRIESYTPAPDQLAEWCQHEPDGPGLVDAIANSNNEFWFWRVFDQRGTAAGCGVRRISQTVARVWLFLPRPHEIVDTCRLLTSVHYWMAQEGYLHWHMLGVPDDPRWPLAAHANYTMGAIIQRFSQSPTLVRDLLPPSNKTLRHGRCVPAVLSEKSEMRSDAAIQQYAESRIHSQDGPAPVGSAREQWDEIVDSVDNPRLAFHSDNWRTEPEGRNCDSTRGSHEGSGYSGVILLETVSELAWEVRYLGVSHRHRREGQAQCLLHWAMHAAADAGVEELFAWVDASNIPAVECYRRREFVSGTPWQRWNYTLDN